jgi:hypothetical protein
MIYHLKCILVRNHLVHDLLVLDIQLVEAGLEQHLLVLILLNGIGDEFRRIHAHLLLRQRCLVRVLDVESGVLRKYVFHHLHLVAHEAKVGLGGGLKIVVQNWGLLGGTVKVLGSCSFNFGDEGFGIGVEGALLLRHGRNIYLNVLLRALGCLG